MDELNIRNFGTNLDFTVTFVDMCLPIDNFG